jgi:hypothetical protein
MAAPPSTRTWYNLMLAMVGDTSSGSCLASDMFLGQSEKSKMIDISIHLWWGAALGASAAIATTQHRVLTTCQNVMPHEPPYMTWSILRRSSMLESELE